MPNPGGFAIGKNLNYGYPGQRSRGASDVVEARPVDSSNTNAIPFGSPVVLNGKNTYSLFGTVATTLTTGLTNGQVGVTSLAVAALPTDIPTGATVVIGSGGTTQTVTTSAAAVAGATSIAVTSFTSNAAYAIGSAVAAQNTFAQFAGIAVREVKQATSYLNQPFGSAQYNPGDPCDVLQQGSVIVTCNVGTPTANGPVYVRVALNGSIPAGVIGGFEAAADGSNTVQITNARWKTGLIDANNSCELTLLTRNMA